MYQCGIEKVKYELSNIVWVGKIEQITLVEIFLNNQRIRIFTWSYMKISNILMVRPYKEHNNTHALDFPTGMLFPLISFHLSKV